MSAISLGMCCHYTVFHILITEIDFLVDFSLPFFLSIIMVCFPLQTGGVGIARMFEKIEHRECMGFDDIVHHV